ncbi:MAG: hypothetical protein HYY65_04050, partial [Candidatus Tectomicrobia bacterium]|nr:hypothetical protein [Candidatus Tectomicrobia bacterium]
VIVLVLLVLPALINLGAYRDVIESRMGRALGRQVSVGKVDLSLIGGVRLRLGDFVLYPVAGENPQVTLSARELRVHLKFLPLLLKEIRLASVKIDTPVVRVAERRTAFTRESFPPGRHGLPASSGEVVRVSTTSDPRPPGRESPAPAQEPRAPWAVWEGVSLGSLDIQKGSLHYFTSNSEPLFSLADLNLSVRNLSLKGTVRFNLKTKVSYQGERVYELSGNIFPNFLNVRSPEVDFSLNSPRLDVESLLLLSRLFQRLPAAAPRAPEAGKPGRAPRDLWSSLIITGRIQADKVFYKGIRMENLEARTRREKDQIKVSSLSFRGAGGLVRAEGVLGYGSREGQISVKASLEQVEAQTLFTALQTGRAPISGPLTLKVDLSSPRGGIKNLGGTGSLQMGPGRFLGQEVESKLQNYSQLIFHKAKTGSLVRYEKITGNLQVGGERVTTQNLTGQWPSFRVVVRGSMDFQGLLDLRAGLYFPDQGILHLQVQGPISGPSLKPDLGETAREAGKGSREIQKGIRGTFQKLLRSLTP